MLNKSINEREVGSFILGLLSNRSWLVRRVDTVEFIDAHTVRRRVTFDVDTRAIEVLQPPELLPKGYVVVPLELLQKTLLVDSNLTDANGSALHIATRADDAYLSWCEFAERARRSNIDLSEGPAVSEHVQGLLSGFPTSDPILISKVQPDWKVNHAHTSWQKADDDCWERLTQAKDWALRKDLYDLTYSFLLVTYVPVADDVSIVKFSSRQNFAIKRNFLLNFIVNLGWWPRELKIPMPGPQDAGRTHLRVRVPENLESTWVSVKRPVFTGEREHKRKLFRRTKDAGTAGEATAPSTGEAELNQRCSVARTADWAHVYVERLDAQRLNAYLGVQLPHTGYIRAGMLTSLFTAAVLWSGVFLRGRLLAAGTGSVEAAVTLLLLAPSVLTAALVRPGEHAIASKMLCWIRFLLGFSMLTVYAAAAVSVLYLHSAAKGDLGRFGDVWDVACGVAMFVAAVLVSVFIVSWSRHRKTTRQSNKTIRVEIEQDEDAAEVNFVAPALAYERSGRPS